VDRAVTHAYQPHDRSQLNPNDPFGPTNCTAYSFARQVDYATLGGVVISGALVRALSDEPKPDPKSPGLNLTQIVAVAHRLHVEFENRTGQGWAGVDAALEEGRSVLLQLDAAVLPAAIRPWKPKTKPFPHATVIDWHTAPGYHWYDPVTGKDRYVTEAQLRPAAEALRKDVFFGVTRVVPWLA
jgi:hypothetical protein